MKSDKWIAVTCANHALRASTYYGLTEHFSRSDLKQLLAEQGEYCVACGETEIALTIDHIVPLVAGGTNTLDNLQLLCKRCNSKKNKKAIDYRLGSPNHLSVTTERCAKKAIKSRLSAVTLRVPPDVYATAQAAADSAGVSMNEYVVTAIAAFSGHKPDLEQRLEQLEAEVRRLQSQIAT